MVNRKKENKKGTLTEEEKKAEASLSLLAMEKDDLIRPHFNLKDLLVENDSSKKTKRKKKLAESKSERKLQDNFEVVLFFIILFLNNVKNLDLILNKIFNVVECERSTL